MNDFIVAIASFPGGCTLPPLVWRERVVLCPGCWMMVSLDDRRCPACGKKFEEHPDIRTRRHEAREKTKRDAVRITAIIVIALSTSLLMVTILLNYLHTWVRPIEQDKLLYLLPAAAGVFIAIWLLIRNSQKKRSWEGVSRAGILAPFAVLGISTFGLIVFAFAGHVDRLLTSASTIAPGIFTGVLIIGLTLFTISKSSSRNKNDRHMI
jgi:hypothetical protein